MQEQTLAWKIDCILEELCPAFDLKKKEADVAVEENSESDDDYWKFKLLIISNL